MLRFALAYSTRSFCSPRCSPWRWQALRYSRSRIRRRRKVHLRAAGARLRTRATQGSHSDTSVPRINSSRFGLVLQARWSQASALRPRPVPFQTHQVGAVLNPLRDRQWSPAASPVGDRVRRIAVGARLASTTTRARGRTQRGFVGVVLADPALIVAAPASDGAILVHVLSCMTVLILLCRGR